MSRVDVESGETLLLGSGELHMEVSLATLRALSGISAITLSPPIVSFRETVRAAPEGSGGGGEAQLGKSRNKHNRVKIRAYALGADAVNGMESSATLVGACGDVEVSKMLGVPAKAVMSVGPAEPATDGTGPSCVLLDGTFGPERAQLALVRDSIVQAFEEVAGAGPLAGQRLRGIVFEVVACKAHQDGKHRSPTQVVPAAARAIKAAVMAAGPALLEPCYVASVSIQQDAAPSSSIPRASAIGGDTAASGSRRSGAEGVYDVLRRAGATGLVEDLAQGRSSSSSARIVEAVLPVRASFGLSERLRGSTGGRAALALAPGGWCPVRGDPLANAIEAAGGQNASRVLLDELRRKGGLPAELPTTEDFADKL